MFLPYPRRAYRCRRLEGLVYRTEGALFQRKLGLIALTVE
jgi:hypothetical protein